MSEPIPRREDCFIEALAERPQPALGQASRRRVQRRQLGAAIRDSQNMIYVLLTKVSGAKTTRELLIDERFKAKGRVQKRVRPSRMTSLENSGGKERSPHGQRFGAPLSSEDAEAEEEG
jgi:hypothetical protein